MATRIVLSMANKKMQEGPHYLLEESGDGGIKKVICVNMDSYLGRSTIFWGII